MARSRLRGNVAPLKCEHASRQIQNCQYVSQGCRCKLMAYNRIRTSRITVWPQPLFTVLISSL